MNTKSKNLIILKIYILKLLKTITNIDKIFFIKIITLNIYKILLISVHQFIKTTQRMLFFVLKQDSKRCSFYKVRIINKIERKENGKAQIHYSHYLSQIGISYKSSLQYIKFTKLNFENDYLKLL